MLAGMPVKDLARYSGVSARALAAWREKADNEGFSSLRAVKQTGRPKGLSDSQIAEIKDVIANDPEPSGYGSWTGRALSEHIESAYGLKYSARTCQKLLRSFRSGRCFLKEAGHYRSTVCWFPQSRKERQVMVVAPLLFQTAFNYAFYPPVAGRSPRLYELAPMGSRRFTIFPGTSPPSGSSLAGTVSFLSPCHGSRRTGLPRSILPWEEGTSSAGAEAPTVSRPPSPDGLAYFADR